MELENIILSKFSQGQKAKGHIFSFIWSHTNSSNAIYTFKCIQNMYPNVGLREDIKGGGKEGKKDSE
jgi:hypothetical protein